jgi:hypothetical protein
MGVQPHHGLMAQSQKPRLLLPPIGVHQDCQRSPDMWRHHRSRRRLRPPRILPAAVVGLLTATLITPTIMIAIVGFAVCPATKPMVRLRRRERLPAEPITTSTHRLPFSKHRTRASCDRREFTDQTLGTLSPLRDKSCSGGLFREGKL